MCIRDRLYHTKNHRGTTTREDLLWQNAEIIPYQEPPGNYNRSPLPPSPPLIIPYQEPPGNYNPKSNQRLRRSIIPYQEPPGNYNFALPCLAAWLHYTIPRTTGELQLWTKKPLQMKNYTIPRTTGELQPQLPITQRPNHYTIPRTTGELQRRLFCFQIPAILYHTKNHRGTTTSFSLPCLQQ